MILIPVFGVLGQDPLLLRLEGGQDEGTAVQKGIVVGAELAAAFTEEGTVNGHIGAEGDHGQEVGPGGLQGEFQGVVVQRLDADVFGGEFGNLFQNLVLAVLVLQDLHGVAVFVGAVHGVGQGHLVGGPVVVGVGTGDDTAHGIEGVGIVDGVTGILRGGDPVVGGDGGHHFAVLIHPVHTLADVEGPDGGVLVGFPGGCQSGLDIPQGIVFHQAVHHVGQDHQLVGGAGGQIVQGGNLGGIQRSVDRGTGF